MNPLRIRPRSGRLPAVLLGLAVSFVAAVDLIRALRPGVLLDPDPSWAVARLALGLFVLAASAAAGGVAAGLFSLWSRTAMASEGPVPVSLRRGTLVLLAVAAIAAGAALRLAALDRIPWPVFLDEASLVTPALQLEGSWCDFRDSIRPAPYRAGAFTMVGVLFLEAFRIVLHFWGTTVFAIRFPAFATAALSLVTAALLGRALLPRGGGALTAVTLAGLRWHMNLSRWAWCPTTMTFTTDTGTLFLLAARRRESRILAAAGGFAVGLGAHVYLSAWPAALALAGFAAWPRPEGPARPRGRLAAAYLLGLAVAVLPLFLFREGRVLPYFNRASDHNILKEIRYNKSLMPPFAAAADGLASPWLPDPTPRHDLPRSRLGLLGIPLAIAFGRALLSPRKAFSALLLLHAGAAFAASVAGGQAGHPNGLRYGYLATPAAVAIASGVLSLLRPVPQARRRLAALMAVGVLAIASALGARGSFAWARDRNTFDGFHGQDTLVGRAALRWDAYGPVRIAPGVPHDPVTIYVIRHYRLDTDERVVAGARPEFWVPRRAARSFRIEPPETRPDADERIVERIRDGWGRPWAVVFGRRT
ncbi:MAG TPA: hypothetical protein VK416_11095 [Thermoanaerobaculia bacterium]|nr:hypothetical protein [Thermoanaerobaculia bacterium]